MGGDHGAKAAAAKQAQDEAIIAQQMAEQKAIRDKITGAMDKYLNGSIGFDPEQKSIMQSQFLNQNALNFNQAGSSVMASLRARNAAGGDTPAGGDFVRGLEALQGARAQSQSQGILGTNLADLQQALNNKFNAASVEAGQSAQIGSNINSFNDAASNDLAQYVKAKSTPGFMQSLATSLAGGVASTASAFGTGGLLALTGMLKPKPYTSSAPGSDGGSTNWGGWNPSGGPSYT